MFILLVSLRNLSYSVNTMSYLNLCFWRDCIVEFRVVTTTGLQSLFKGLDFFLCPPCLMSCLKYWDNFRAMILWTIDYSCSTTLKLVSSLRRNHLLNLNPVFAVQFDSLIEFFFFIFGPNKVFMTFLEGREQVSIRMVFIFSNLMEQLFWMPSYLLFCLRRD